MKCLFLFFFAVALTACTNGGDVRPDVSAVHMPEPLLGINVFVAGSLVKLPSDGSLAQKPNPYRPLSFDEDATVETRQLAAGFSTDLRESVLPIFRGKLAQTYCFVAGASYPWNELRRDQRNYYLVIWPARSGAQSQQVDVHAVLVHEATGRQVWQYTFKAPYRTEAEKPGRLSHAERLSVVQTMSEKLLSELSRQGFMNVASVSGRN